MPTVYLELTSGLGNQLFQWATATALAEAIGPGTRVVLDTRKLSRPASRGFGLARVGLVNADSAEVFAGSHAAVLFWRLAGKLPARVFAKLHTTFSLKPPVASSVEVASFEAGAQAVGSGADSVWLRGYLQHPGAFSGRRRELTERLESALSMVLDARGESLPKLPGNYAAIHARRGDYLAHPHLGVCSVEYYVGAFRSFADQLPCLLVSDDPKWCRDVLAPALGGRVTVIESGDDLVDLQILRGAKQLAVSNSTFSWWAAFSGQADLVVCPMPWHDADDYDLALIDAIATVRLDKATGNITPSRAGSSSC